MNPLKIAVQGLQPGATPLEIASQGLLVQITPPQPEEEADGVWIPLRSFGPGIKSKPRQDASVEVSGCTAHLRCTDANIARSNPTFEELDHLDDLSFMLQKRREAREAFEAALEERAFRNWQLRFDSVTERLADRARKKEFRRQVNGLLAQTKAGDLDALCALVVGLADETHKLRAELTAAKTPRRKAPKK